MFGTVSQEREVNVPASQAWELYSTLQLANLTQQQLSTFIQEIQLVEGDGGVGTVLNLIFAPGKSVFTSYKEKFTKIDHEKRVKETEVVEGGYLDIGFTLFRVRFEIIEKGEDCCITRSTMEYDVKEKDAANASSIVSIQPLVMIMEAAANHLMIKNNKTVEDH